MIPDKIYIQENDPSMRYGVNQDADINGMHEYIRKEAIIEKLNSIWGEYYTMRNVRAIIDSM